MSRDGTQRNASEAWPGVPTLDAALGRRLAELRTAQGQTADQLARAAKDIGLTWDRSTVASIETGRRKITASELLVLPLLLGVPLADLMPTTPTTVAKLRLRPQLLHALVSTPDTQQHTVRDVAGRIDDVNKAVSRFRDDLTAGRNLIRGRPVTQDAFVKRWTPTVQASGDAETDAAKRHNLTPRAFAAVSVALWGGTLSSERDARLDSDTASTETIRAKRGRITRDLDTEITQYLQGE